MSETRFPPPRPPASGTTAGSGDRPTIQNALVTHASAAVTEGSTGKTLLLDGRVSAFNPQRGETTIATAKGDITVQTGGTSLPIGTEVSIETRMQGLSLRANITVMRQKSAEARAAQDMPRPSMADTPRPPADGIKTGDRILALRLPADTPPAETPGETPADAPDVPPRPTLEQAARIIEAARAAVSIPRLAALLPPVTGVPLPVVWQVLNTRDVMTALVRLPEAMQAQMLDYLARSDVAAALRQALPPVQANTLLPHAPAPADAQDMAQAQMALRPAPAASADTAAPMPRTSSIMTTMLPMLETLLPAGGQASSMMMLAGKVPQMPTGPQNLPLPQNMMQLTVQSIYAPKVAIPAPLPPGSMIVTVESHTANGAAILKGPDAHFVLRQNTPLPLGTQLIVTMHPATAADMLADTAPITRSTAALDPFFSRSWPALDEALALLNASTAQIAQAITQSIPAATARLAPTTLFFLAALRMGNVESWLGEPALSALRGGGRKDLAERLSQDFGKLASLSKNVIAGEWRAISMPLMQQDQHIHMIQLFLRHMPPDENSQGEEQGTPQKMTRFILNLHLSRMGDMQLDGFLHKKRFDLILRSEEKLPAAIRQELLQKFAAGLDQTGMQGGMTFQTRAESWMQIPETAGAGTQV